MDTVNIKRILAPVDFSDSSLNALDTAVAMAKRHGAVLNLLHIANENFQVYGHPNVDILPLTPPAIESIREASQTKLGLLVDNLIEQHGIEAKGEMASGLVTSEICKYAEKSKADLIVMGTHGTSGFREFFIGTNAYAVVKHAPCPVLTVPPNGKWESFSKILFPVRNVDGALEKYTFLRKIIRHNQAILLVLGIPDSDQSIDTNWVKAKISQLNSDLLEDNVRSLTQILKPTKRAAAAVLEKADDEQADLIAITANLDHDFRDFFIGPYTQQIVNHAKVPILSIRPFKPSSAAPKAEEAIRIDFDALRPNLLFQ